MLKIIKGVLVLVIPEGWSIVLEETHITMHFFCKVAHKTTKKVFLPLQTLEINDVCGAGKVRIEAIFKGSIWMPSLETTKLRRRPV